jgi:hypothetical protein
VSGSPGHGNAALRPQGESADPLLHVRTEMSVAIADQLCDSIYDKHYISDGIKCESSANQADLGGLMVCRCRCLIAHFLTPLLAVTFLVSPAVAQDERVLNSSSTPLGTGGPPTKRPANAGSLLVSVDPLSAAPQHPIGLPQPISVKGTSPNITVPWSSNAPHFEN